MSVVVDARNGRRGDYADWVAAFEELWRGGRANVNRFMDIMGPDIRLVAPGLKPTQGKPAATEAFRRTFALLPDLTARVHRWSAGADVVFIEMSFTATVAGRPFTWHNVDRFLFRDGYAVERVAYFNPARLRRAFLGRPAGWLQLLRRARSGL
ncbi:MAG: nuclear transport factor 2 family protein [Pseudomonadota bacterium]